MYIINLLFLSWHIDGIESADSQADIVITCSIGSLSRRKKNSSDGGGDLLRVGLESIVNESTKQKITNSTITFRSLQSFCLLSVFCRHVGGI